ncbi:alpha/beta hydrolase family protein [Ancylobacter oerskovii]|uniref:Alpha/beta hydrolase family protein n=1 Tax=Ancylobacter oerskovii TaxID=459519 RepID=A0ABW4YS60_9HYPH|nr:hypothetical protein [Ancylobacter oerskovii]MBS7545218.1 hypothetical protein [Ancylobacter oerskovii]
MLSRLVLATVLILGLLPGARAADREVGLRRLAAAVGERGATVAVDLWYPAGAGGEPVRQGATPVFEGVAALRNAPAAEGRFPVVLLAHGGLRSNPDLAGWIAAGLAAQGAIVVMPRSPAARPGPGALDEARLRPADLRAALDAVETDPDVAAHRASGRVVAVGFFLGGTSALALAGARLDAQAYRRSCDPPAAGPDCSWFAAQGLDLHAAIDDRVGDPARDPRIAAVIAVDPELTGSLAPASLKEIAVPVTLVRLGPATGAALADVPEDALAGIPALRRVGIAGATPFAAFGRCTPRGAALLVEEGEDDAICREGAGLSRAELQAGMARLIGAAVASAP